MLLGNPHALFPEAFFSSHAVGNRNHGAQGVKETPSLWEAGRRVCCRSSEIFSCLWRFPVLQLRLCQYLPVAKGDVLIPHLCCWLQGSPRLPPNDARQDAPWHGPGECEGFRKILQGTCQAFKMLTACWPAGCPAVSKDV